MAKTVIPTSAPLGSSNPQVDFKKDSFEGLIWQKGHKVIKESALKCSCVSPSVNQQSNCKNCGGTGWIFINPTETRMMSHSINLSTKYKQWSETNVGTVSLTCLSQDELGFMDRITILDGNSIYSQVCFLKRYNGVFYFNTVYPIKQIKYIGVFRDTQQKLTPLVYGVDYTYTENKIIFLTAANFTDTSAQQLDCSITIRYQHAPQYHVLDLPRETIQFFLRGENEKLVDLPIHGIARRVHYVLDQQNFDNTRLLDNSIPVSDIDPFNPEKIIC